MRSVPDDRTAIARIRDAAVDQWGQQGFTVGLRSIAEAAGVSAALVIHHFGSKDGLIEAVYREVVNRHATRVIDASSTGTGRERLLALIDASTRLYTSRTPFYRLLVQLHLESTTNRTHLAPIARRVQRNQRDYMVGLARAGQRDGSIRSDVDADAIGLTVNAALEGFLVQQLEPQGTQRRWIAKFRTLMEDIL